ncbi:TetR/AcrR family transcriptional regulator [Streptomyces sp. CA-111067]|uniref:TetR/AcrR family transcriptional regulator n=1 Tax=Streptomyces sp. CA-111067 TaxID=3240046 RepID=UPI003D98F284
MTPRSRGESVAAAVRIADAEGIEAASMRRVATEVGTATTALYRYVARKDDLLELMIDSVFGEQPPPAKPSGGRQADLRLFGRWSRALTLRHPWMAFLSAGATFGPNRLRSAEYVFGAAQPLGLDIDRMMAAVDGAG